MPPFFDRVLTDELMNAILEDYVDNLPEGLLTLDEQQEQILALTPPLVIESRSGTGKTTVLFQHAFAYARAFEGQEAIQSLQRGSWRQTGRKSILFVTVSKNLSKKMEEVYDEVRSKVEGRLPLIRFYAFRDLLQLLVDYKELQGMDVKNACNFWQYEGTRKSHDELPLHPS